MCQNMRPCHDVRCGVCGGACAVRGCSTGGRSEPKVVTGLQVDVVDVNAAREGAVLQRRLDLE